MSADGNTATCKNCEQPIAYDGPMEDWHHIGMPGTPHDMWCTDDTTGDAPIATPEVTEFQCHFCGETFDYGTERGACDTCLIDNK